MTLCVSQESKIPVQWTVTGNVSDWVTLCGTLSLPQVMNRVVATEQAAGSEASPVVQTATKSRVGGQQAASDKRNGAS